MYPDDETKYFVPEKNAHPVSKGYLDERLADIQPSDAKIFYWDGVKSDSNPDNIILWQEIINTAKEQTVLVYTSKEDSTIEDYRGICIINPGNAQGFNEGSRQLNCNIGGLLFNTNNNDFSSFCYRKTKIALSFADSCVVSVSEVGYSNFALNSYLHTNHNSI